MAKKKKRMVVVTTDKDRRGVFFGELVKETGKTVLLKDAQMAVYWTSNVRGVFGLASIGPLSGSRISPQVPQVRVNGVTAVIECTVKAIVAWRTEPWT